MTPNYAWGWIPNLSGKASEKERIKYILSNADNIAGISIVSDMTYEVSNDAFDTKIVLHIQDCAGLCKIEYEGALDIQSALKIESLWRSFRKIFDGCSNTCCNCTAMDYLYFPKSDGKSDGKIHAIYMEEAKDEYEGLIRLFLENIESISDFCARVSNDPYFIDDLPGKTKKNWKTLIDRVTESQSKCRSDYTYFKRFLSFYATKFSSDYIKEQTDHMSSRVEKAQIAIDDTLQKLSSVYNNNHINTAIKSARFAEVAAIVSMISLIITAFGL